MDNIAIILALILSPAAVIGAVTWMCHRLIERWLSRDLEKHKTALSNEAEVTRLKLQNDLQADLYRFQTTFGSLHNKRAEVVGKIYELLFEAKESVGNLLRLEKANKTVFESNKRETQAKCDKLISYFGVHRIYFDENVCERMDELALSLEIPVALFTFGRLLTQEPAPDFDGGASRMKQAEEAFREEFPPLEQLLRQQFRQILEGSDFGRSN